MIIKRREKCERKRVRLLLIEPEFDRTTIRRKIRLTYASKIESNVYGIGLERYPSSYKIYLGPIAHFSLLRVVFKNNVMK
jgi:hypothetical protein